MAIQEEASRVLVLPTMHSLINDITIRSCSMFEVKIKRSSRKNNEPKLSQPVKFILNKRALIFRRTLTEGPENNSRIVGKAEGFIIPHEDFANSDFNVIYLTLETPEYTGSVSIRSREMTHKLEEVMEVVGGTGAFAFARGIAMFAEVDDHEEEAVTTYRVKLLLRFPHTSHLDPQ
ncbi:PREDICTED: dirigent protein 2-like [Camelina sativa]|uniref:Dirigent protein n=1 Tax=Camelina sativa TaxID=90675 RepID=A0ABM0XEU4_CAMSA|nr:PREDICTED: dirigent protein 2-like [Camelina sativa]